MTDLHQPRRPRVARAQALDEHNHDGRFQAVRVLDGEAAGAVYLVPRNSLRVGDELTVMWHPDDQFAALVE